MTYFATSGRTRVRRPKRRNAEINITNLMDVMMVLLVVFMVAAPLMTSGIALNLPKVGGQNLTGKETSLNISVNREGVYYIGKDEIAADTVKEVLGDDATAIDFGATLYLTDEAKVYIQNPRSNDFVASATISDLSVATSGDYQRYYFFDGVRYHHVIGRDGYPAGIFDGDPVVSATITSPSAAVSDALSTAAMVLGNTDTLKALLDKYDAAAVLITESGRYVVGDSPFVFE